MNHDEYKVTPLLECLFFKAEQQIKARGSFLLKAGVGAGKTSFVWELVKRLPITSIHLNGPGSISTFMTQPNRKGNFEIKLFDPTRALTDSRPLIFFDEVFRNEASYYMYADSSKKYWTVAVGSRTAEYDQDPRWKTELAVSLATWDMNPLLPRSNNIYSECGSFPEMQYKYGAF